jgi:1,4-alpha-glucan branching enzyme
MPASLDHVHPHTHMGANLVADGATFRVWAPNALAVHVIGSFNGGAPDDANLLNPVGGGHWAGFVPGVKDRDRYMFHVVGQGSEGPKRDPYARELEQPFPAGCIVRETDFPWHDTGYVTPRFADFVIYQLHAGTFHTPRLPRGGTFLDVALKLPYLDELGVTAVQLLPIQEFQTEFSMGYNGTDYFAPEMDFAVADADLPGYAAQVNALLAARGLAPYAMEDLRGEMNQLKAFVDLCHVHGIAVLLDVVYNHAGGSWGDESIWFFDRQSTDGGDRNSLYFTDIDHAGGRVFDFAKPEVRDFLIQNARFFLDEYRLDGFRYDQVSVIDHDGRPHGWSFLQDLTSTLHAHRPGAFHKAEYWGVNPWIVKPAAEGGAGFDSSLTDGLRIALRDVIREAANPDARPLAMRRLGESLWPQGFAEHWQFVQGPENHDIVFNGREPRMARLGDPGNPRSWYGRSRARVATGVSLTAPGIPMLFMGQEFLEDKQWSDNLQYHGGLRLHWQGLDDGDRQMHDHLRFVRELLALRWSHPGLRGQGFRVVWADDADRVLAFHRWIPGEGHDVMVVVHLSTDDRHGYRIGFPGGGEWREVFNSDVYESWVNPDVTGNGGRVFADAWGMHGFAHSAALTLPANGLLVFAR